MASTYDILKSEHGDSESSHISANPYWIVAVFRLENPVTYDRVKGESFSKNFTDAVKIVGPPLVITDDCIQLQVSHSKQSYISQLSATLANSGINYLSQIFPGDYIFAWMVNDEVKYQSIIDRLLKKNTPSASSTVSQESNKEDYSCNKFDDGLKFYGRVQGTRKNLSQQPNGLKIVRYSLNAVGFSEFDAQIFYNAYLANTPDGLPQISTFFSKLNIALGKLVERSKIEDDGVAGIKTITALVLFIDLLLGRGVPKNLGQEVILDGLKNTDGLDAEASYIIPIEVGEVLGKTKRSGGVLRFADMLECLVGTQKYSYQLNETEIELIKSESGESGKSISKSLMFQPDGTYYAGSRRIAGDMLGTFLIQQPNFTNKPVWTILRQFLNEAINEMYTCLRVNPDGSVVPTFVARQLPFTSPAFKQTEYGNAVKHTEFLELPRWKIAPVLVKDVDVGRSDALRFNWIGVYGDYPDPNRTITQQIVENNPKVDNLDIARGGLRMYMQTVACSALDVRGDGPYKGAPKKWMAICSDFLMGQQMALTGSMNVLGIQSPICPGDNLEWDGMVFHIESVSHSCFISPMGQKTFTTNITLSHGVRIDPQLERSDNSPAGQVDFYGGVKSNDMVQYEPGTTASRENAPILVNRIQENLEEIDILLMDDKKDRLA